MCRGGSTAATVAATTPISARGKVAARSLSGIKEKPFKVKGGVPLSCALTAKEREREINILIK